MECEKAQRMIFVSWFPKVLPFENGVYIAGTKRLILYYLLYSTVLNSTCFKFQLSKREDSPLHEERNYLYIRETVIVDASKPGHTACATLTFNFKS